LGKAPRIAYGEALLDQARIHRDIVALDADLSKSTMSCLIEEHFPERYFEMSIAEQNMMATAAGMALHGKIPFVNSFAVFVTGRAFDQVRQSVAYPANNVKIAGSSSGFSDYGDGATHQSIEDLAIMRALPHMVVLSPADEIETRAMVQFMVEHHGPVYIRLDRNETPVVLPPDYRFVLGEPTLLQSGRDVAIFATGRMVSLALGARRHHCGRAERGHDQTDERGVHYPTRSTGGRRRDGGRAQHLRGPRIRDRRGAHARQDSHRARSGHGSIRPVGADLRRAAGRIRPNRGRDLRRG
jgi:transketolase C-terminal domain/subunit